MSSKGEETRERIVERAFRLASRDGLNGLTVGTLAADLGLSKSGLFAHFGSKEELQVEVLRAAAEYFQDHVLKKGFVAPRGLPRLRKVFENWLSWVTDPSLPGGCVFVAASAELDDKPGRARDFLAATQKDLLTTLARTVRLGVDVGHLVAGTDCEQLAFEMYGIVLAFNHAHRLLRDPKALTRARRAFDRLVQSSKAL
ncbi:MAG: transcriptional regulator, TetR family [Myxococcales bacterium]|nr:transcriptional regulator, TetR family [Myxococcales bacterium]